MFFEEFRAGVGRYAAGVHELGAPASAKVVARLPKPLRDFYRSFDGAHLYHGAVVLLPAASLAPGAAGSPWRVGEALGAPLFADEAGRLIEEDDEGDRVVVGSSLERWLAAVMAREGLLVDREGEWKDVFDGGQLAPEVRRKRTRVALKADPDAAAWHLEAAELAFEDGKVDDASASLRRAVGLDPGAGAAWELLGALARRAGRLDDAEAAYARAAAAAGDPARRSERWAEAARAAMEAGRERERAEHGARAGRVEAWVEEARRLLEEGDLEGALNRATLAQAVHDDEETRAVVAHLRARTKLRVL